MISALRYRPVAPLLLAAALACSSGGGAKAPEAAPVPAAPPSDIPPVRVVLGTAPSFEGVATGNGWADGSASADAGARYFREVSGSRGQVFELKNDATGDEKDKACGKDWRTSTARSAAVVTPDAGRGNVGFSLSAIATARRGYWRTKATLSCTTINYTEAQAATMARGQASILLGGRAGDRDQLVVETTGSNSSEWALSVTDSAGTKYAPTSVGSTLVAAVPGAGRYSVAASVTARVATAGGKDSVDQRLKATVRVSSLRYALATAIGSPPLGNLDASFTVDVPAAALVAPMDAALAGYQPCAAKPGCAGKVSDLSVNATSVRAAGGGAVVQLTLVGKKRAPLPVRLVGSVVVRADSLRIVDLRLADGQPQVSKKRDLSAAVSLFAGRASSVAATPLAPRQGAAESALRARFPVRVGDLCVEAPAGAAAFNGTAPASDSTAFRVYFGLTPTPLQPCGRPK